MSYDLVVWSRYGVSTLSQTLCDEGFVQTASNHWEVATKRWTISVDIDAIEDEDIPDEVFATLRGITHQISLHLMPFDAAEAAKAKAKRIARSLAESGHGVWQDLRTDKLALSKSARLVPRQGRQSSSSSLSFDRSVTVLSLDWCMNHSKLMTREGINGFLNLLQRFLPEALPRRYGPYEPLRFKYGEMGREHFVDTYLEDPATSIYCTRPAFSLSLPSIGHGYRKIGMQNKYWANNVRISLDAELLDDSYWSAHFPKVFVAISQYLQPFYGDARCLVGYAASKNGSLKLLTRDVPNTPNGTAETSPVSPWWRGVPRSAGIACVVGAPYTELWPDREGWEEHDGLSVYQPGVWENLNANYSVPDNISEPPKRSTEIRTAEDLRLNQENEALRPPIIPF
ncbi:MAG: hypothetical protein ABJP33_14315 [Pseudoruegeria sp.]